jgi:hypothetical protein
MEFDNPIQYIIGDSRLDGADAHHSLSGAAIIRSQHRRHPYVEAQQRLTGHLSLLAGGYQARPRGERAGLRKPLGAFPDLPGR